MPLNSLTNNRVDFPLVYVPPEFAGRDIEISLFDTDQHLISYASILTLPAQTVWQALINKQHV